MSEALAGIKIYKDGSYQIALTNKFIEKLLKGYKKGDAYIIRHSEIKIIKE